jgi:hypothetical protein
MTAMHIITATTVTDVWLALGGPEPKRGRARAFYRNGENTQAVSLDDAKGCWYDHRDGKGGGLLDLIQLVLGRDRAGALRWLSNFTGLPLDDRPATRSERRALAERREREQREMRNAKFFRIAAVCVAEQALAELPEAVPGRFAPTQLFLSLRASHGRALLAVYRGFREHEPELTAALVYAGERAWQRMCTRLAHFVAGGAEVLRVG